MFKNRRNGVISHKYFVIDDTIFIMFCNEAIKHKYLLIDVVKGVMQMLVIVRPRTKKRLSLGGRVLITVLILSMVFGHLYNTLHGKNMIKEGWLRNDRPSGNPMRVENVQNKKENRNPGVLNQFVVKLRDFYHQDR